MSCRSTPFTSAATSYAKFLTPYFSDSQTQSLFHELKAESTLSAHDPCPAQEYYASIEKLMFRVRNDSNLSEAKRDSLLKRLELSLSGPVINAKSWDAATRLHDRVGVARLQYESVLDTAAESLGLNRQEIHNLVVHARGGSWHGEGGFIDYSDYPAEFRFDRVPGLPSDESTQRALRKLGYETFLAQKYPVFVYGTLRSGMGNHHILVDGSAGFGQGELKGVGIYGAHRGFPYAAEHDDPDVHTIGEVHWIYDTPAGSMSRQRMDWLEGFDSNNPLNSHYERRKVEVNVSDDKGQVSKVEAWTYLARGSARRQLQEYDRIVDGDWVIAREQARTERTLRQQLLGLD